jgi:hypothetical protein
MCQPPRYIVIDYENVTVCGHLLGKPRFEIVMLALLL